MDDHVISVVRESFDLIEPIAPQAGEMFYGELFAADPGLRPLFKGDPQDQATRLMVMMTLAINALDRPDELWPLLDNLGRRHAAYGVRDEHYETVGAAWLRTLHWGLGVAYNEEVETAWIEVYRAMATRMKQAANAPAALSAR